MSADTELLRRYVEERSEVAFAELVRLHLNLVYFAALRLLGGDAHHAKDVTQAVFTDLARKAATLIDRPTLTGWLHTSTRFAAAKVRRAEFSRQQRHQEAETMHALLRDDSASGTEWERLRPVIDDVVHELGERDREAVLLRFFENRPFAEIGTTLHISEDAARMRVERALEKLRRALARRGVASTTGALALAFANQAGATAPTGLLACVTAAALMPVSGAAAASGVVGGAKVFLGLAAALVVAGASVLVWHQTSARPSVVSSPAVARPSSFPFARALEPQRSASGIAPDAPVATVPERTEWKSTSELRRAGRGTPCAALETLILAVVENDIDVFIPAIQLTPTLQEKFASQLARLPADARAKFGPPERLYALEAVERAGRDAALIAAIRVIEQRKIDSDHATLLVQLQLVGGAVHEQTLAFDRAADGWRLTLSK